MSWGCRQNEVRGFRSNRGRLARMIWPRVINKLWFCSPVLVTITSKTYRLSEVSFNITMFVLRVPYLYVKRSTRIYFPKICETIKDFNEVYGLF